MPAASPEETPAAAVVAPEPNAAPVPSESSPAASPPLPPTGEKEQEERAQEEEARKLKERRERTDRSAAERGAKEEDAEATSQARRVLFIGVSIFGTKLS